jgi:DNA-binding MurR/RpiR family transcriptional regulator
MRFLEKLTDSNSSFTLSQRAIASYMQVHVDSIAFYTLETLASKIGVSTTTIIRFSRAIGYSGFADMQQAVKDEIQSKTALPERLDSMDSISGNELLKESFGMDEENIRLTLAAQNDDDLKKAIEWVSGAKKVYLLGMRSSFSLAFYMASRLGEIKTCISFSQPVCFIPKKLWEPIRMMSALPIFFRVIPKPPAIFYHG